MKYIITGSLQPLETSVMDVEELLVVVCVNDLLIIVFYVIDQIKILQWMGAEFGCGTNEAL